MKLLVVSLMMMGTTAWADESAHLDFQAPVIEEIASEEITLNNVGSFEDCNNKSRVMAAADEPIGPVEAIDIVDVVVDQIINIGKKVWAIVEMGRPVTNLKTYSANALPKGIFCWADLAGWTPTQAKTYRVTYKNLYGGTVVDFAFRLLYTTGGNYKGRGQYITNATIIPAQVSVSWGYTFNADSQVPTVFNTGSSEMPVAGMHMNMNWAVKTVMKTDIRTESFFIGGDGSFKRLD